MKNLRTIALCVSVSLYSMCATAQTGSIPINEPNLSKPKLFQNLPDVIPVKMNNITTLFGAEVGRPVSISLSDATSFQFEGHIVSSVSKYENTMECIVIRSTNYPGARLAITRLTDASGTISYTGRILSMQHGDLYELTLENSQFVLVKRKFYDLVNE